MGEKKPRVFSGALGCINQEEDIDTEGDITINIGTLRADSSPVMRSFWAMRAPVRERTSPVLLT